MAEFAGPVRQPPLPEPVVVPESALDLEHATKAGRAIPVWVRLTYEDGTEREVKGFAHGWTKAHVLVQVPWHFDYYESVKSVWVDAATVRRRQLDPRVR